MLDTVDVVLVSSTNDSHDCIQVYDALTGSILHNYKGLQASTSSLAITGPNRIVLCACKDRAMVQTWQLNKREMLNTRLCLPGKINSLAVSPFQPTILVVGIKNVLHIYNLESGCRLCVLDRHYQAITKIVFSVCGNYFFSGGEDGLAYSWCMGAITLASHDASVGILPHSNLHQHADKITDICCSSDKLVTVSLDQTAKVYNFNSFTILHQIAFNSGITSVSITPEGSRLAIGSNIGTVVVVDIFPSCSEKVIKVQDSEYTSCHEGEVISVKFLPSGCTVLTAGQEDGEVKVWQVKENFENAIYSDKKLGNVKNLAWKRTFNRGKGMISNMITSTVERQVLMKGWNCDPIIHELHTNSSRETPIVFSSEDCDRDYFVDSYCPSLQQFPSNYGRDFSASILSKNL